MMTPTPIGKPRNAGVVLLLIFVTLGIYLLIWYYKINCEIKEHDPSQDFSPGLAMFALFIFIVNLVSYYNTANRIKIMQKADAADDLISPGAALLWALLFFIGYPIYIQSALNNHWHEHRNDVIVPNYQQVSGPPSAVIQANRPVDVAVIKGPDLGITGAIPGLAYNLYALSGGACVELTHDPVILGRYTKVSNLIIPVGNVSRKHCTLKLVNGAALSEDNGSVNGTFLTNGQRLISGQPYNLQIGDRFFLIDRGIMFEIRSVN